MPGFYNIRCCPVIMALPADQHSQMFISFLRYHHSKLDLEVNGYNFSCRNKKTSLFGTRCNILLSNPLKISLKAVFSMLINIYSFLASTALATSWDWLMMLPRQPIRAGKSFRHLMKKKN